VSSLEYPWDQLLEVIFITLRSTGKLLLRRNRVY